MDPFLIPRFIALAFALWIRLLGKKRFWALFAASSSVATFLIIRDSV